MFPGGFEMRGAVNHVLPSFYFRPALLNKDETDETKARD
jgi:hypothetical protein